MENNKNDEQFQLTRGKRTSDMSSSQSSSLEEKSDKTETETREPARKRAREEKKEEEEKDSSKDDVTAVLSQLQSVFGACVRADGSFAAKKFGSACCAGARMLGRGVGTETHAAAWHAVLCAAASAFHRGCTFPPTLAALLASATTGEGYCGVEGAWHGLLDAADAAPALTAHAEGAWTATLGAWRSERDAVRAVEAADDALTLDRALAPVRRSVEAAHRAVAAAHTVAARDALDEAEANTLVAEAQPTGDTKAAWMRTAAACAALCLQPTRMFWAPRCLDGLGDLLVDRCRTLFTEDEVRQLEQWRSEVRAAACAKRSGTGTHADAEQPSQFDRDLRKWQSLDVPRGKSTSSDYF